MDFNTAADRRDERTSGLLNAPQPNLSQADPSSGLRRVSTWSTLDRELAQEGLSTAQSRSGRHDIEHTESMAEREFSNNIWVQGYVKYFQKSVLNYNSEGIIGPGVFIAAFTAASILNRKQLLRDIFLIVLSAVVVGLVLFWRGIEVAGPDMEKLINLVKDFQTLCTFLLGFFVSTCLTRWWAIRNDCINSLWACGDDLVLILGSYFGRDTEADKQVRETIVRWTILSYELVYKQARAEEDISDLVEKGLLFPHELDILLPEASKPQVIWSWMCGYMAHLAYGNPQAGGSRLPYPVTVLPQLHEICRHARGAIGMLFAYTDTQVPFRYVHFLALIIWMHNLFQAVTSAAVFSNALIGHQELTFTTIVIEFIFLLFHPLVYFGLLHLGVGMLNPLRGKRDIDFPKGAWTFLMFAEMRSLFSANTKPRGPPYGDPPVWQTPSPTPGAGVPGAASSAAGAGLGLGSGNSGGSLVPQGRGSGGGSSLSATRGTTALATSKSSSLESLAEGGNPRSGREEIVVMQTSLSELFPEESS